MVERHEPRGESIQMTLGGRNFQFWEYRVSHGELLLRSPKTDEFPLNVDIVFADVRYVALPRFLPGLQIAEAPERDVARAEEHLGVAVDPRTVTVLESGGRRHLVVAAFRAVTESDMDIFGSPLGK